MVEFQTPAIKLTHKAETEVPGLKTDMFGVVLLMPLVIVRILRMLQLLITAELTLVQKEDAVFPETIK